MSEDRVTFTLCNPLRTVDAQELGLEPRVYNVGERLTMLRRDAMRVVEAGCVRGAEPGNPATVHAALTPVKPTATGKPALGKAAAEASKGE